MLLYGKQLTPDESVNWLIVQKPENFDDSRAYYPPKLLF